MTGDSMPRRRSSRRRPPGVASTSSSAALRGSRPAPALPRVSCEFASGAARMASATSASTRARRSACWRPSRQFARRAPAALLLRPGMLRAVASRQIMTADDLRRALVRISHEIVEKHGGTDGLALLGVQRRGVPLSDRLAALIEEHEGVRLPVGKVDITNYRDDLSTQSRQPLIKGTDIPF